MSDSINLLTPVGRIVYESIFTPNTKNMRGVPLTGRDGLPREEYVLKLAIEKTTKGLKEFTQQLQKYAVANLGADAVKHEGFSWKFEDGDKTDKPHYKGCLVFKFKTGYAPQIVKDQGKTIVTREMLKAGDYARAYISVTPNKEVNPQGGLGLYLNLSIVEWLAFGDKISSGPDAQSILSESPVDVLPAGASRTPTAPAQQMETVAAQATPDYEILDNPFNI